MKSILENRPALAAEVNKGAEVAGYLWQKGWAERNGGNITVNITEFVDDEILTYLIKENSDSVSRLRCFINDTNDDNIYKLDGYGNLENVNINDFEFCIDEAITKLKESLEV